MYHYKIELANRIFDVKTIHVRPYIMCQEFICEGVPDYFIENTKSDIDQDLLVYESIYGINTTWDGAIEPTTLLRKTAEAIIDFGAFFMHGAAIAVNNEAYLFTAASGTGKTTHIRLWLKNNPDVFIVNGDKPIILTGDMPLLCSSPWAGKENYFTNTKVPLKAIILMDRNDENEIHKISFMEAFPTLFQQIYRSKDSKKIVKTLSLLKSLDSKVSFYRFNFNNYKEDCFQVVYDALACSSKSADQ